MAEIIRRLPPPGAPLTLSPDQSWNGLARNRDQLGDPGCRICPKSAREPRSSYVRRERGDHKDGSVWAKGQRINGVMMGYWEWFRKDGTRMRSGYFEDDAQVGQWTTYDKSGRVVKVTSMTPKAK